jgi:nicotinamide N-methyltransferase
MTSIYQSFDSNAYLNEYYQMIAHDAQSMLHFMVTSFQHMPAALRVLDFGGGPTLYTAIVAAERALEIHLSDYSAANRRAVEAWLHAEAEAFDWRHFVEAVLALEGREASAAAVAAREALVRARLRAVLVCDVTQQPPLAIPDEGAYDVVCANLCLEAVAQDAREWRRYLQHLAALVRPGGHLLMTTVRRGTIYPIGTQLFPIAYLDEDDVRVGLQEAGFMEESITMQIVPSDHPVHPYDGLILTAAVKVSSI